MASDSSPPYSKEPLLPKPNQNTNQNTNENTEESITDDEEIIFTGPAPPPTKIRAQNFRNPQIQLPELHGFYCPLRHSPPPLSFSRYPEHASKDCPFCFHRCVAEYTQRVIEKGREMLAQENWDCEFLTREEVREKYEGAKELLLEHLGFWERECVVEFQRRRGREDMEDWDPVPPYSPSDLPAYVDFSTEDLQRAKRGALISDLVSDLEKGMEGLDLQCEQMQQKPMSRS